MVKNAGYETFGWFSAEAESFMRDCLAAKPKAKHGVHRNEFVDTGLDLETERLRFREYHQQCGVLSEFWE